MSRRDPRTLVKQLVPPALLDRVLLTFPVLYHTSLVNYETNLDSTRVATLLEHLRRALSVEGDVIECGSSRGGSAVLMAREIGASGQRRRVFACDSFAGFNRRELTAERTAGLTDVDDEAFTSTSLEYVRRKFVALGLGDVVQPVPGYFQDTLPALRGRYCLAFIDCDLRESIAYCARQLWPRITSGGEIVFDDYQADGWRGAALGVQHFLAEQVDSIADHGEQNGLYWAVKR